MRLHAVVRGRVQGVGFRYWVLEEARSLGLKGWVRNLPDRSVEVLAEGDEDTLLEMEQRLWKGPFLSRVDDVAADYSPQDSQIAGFEIRS
ncbi:MAG: acylphosphatase [Candidatus Sumerlaeaceae bacterium]|nr:acylphosphatase [Candidatus Sumerlaeaceae bacterium]